MIDGGAGAEMRAGVEMGWGKEGSRVRWRIARRRAGARAGARARARAGSGGGSGGAARANQHVEWKYHQGGNLCVSFTFEISSWQQASPGTRRIIENGGLGQRRTVGRACCERCRVMLWTAV